MAGFFIINIYVLCLVQVGGIIVYCYKSYTLITFKTQDCIPLFVCEAHQQTAFTLRTVR